MHIQEKQAWYILGVFAVTLAGTLLVAVLTDWHQGSLGMLGLGGFAGFAPLIGRGKKQSGEIVIDERDMEIDRDANLLGYSVFWVLFVLAACGPMFIYGVDTAIEIRTGQLGFGPVLGLFVLFSVRSAYIVIQYRRGR